MILACQYALISLNFSGLGGCWLRCLLKFVSLALAYSFRSGAKRATAPRRKPHRLGGVSSPGCSIRQKHLDKGLGASSALVGFGMGCEGYTDSIAHSPLREQTRR